MIKLVLNSLIAIALFAHVAAAQDLWTPKTSSPTNAVNHGFVESGGYLYRLGFGNPGPTVRYDPIADIWSTKASMSVDNKSFASAAFNGTLYVFGNGSARTTDCYAYNIATDTWRT